MFCSRACYWKWWPEHRAEEVARQGREPLARLHDEGRDPRATPQAAWKRKMAFRHSALEVFDSHDGDDELWAERVANPRPVSTHKRRCWTGKRRRALSNPLDRHPTGLAVTPAAAFRRSSPHVFLGMAPAVGRSSLWMWRSRSPSRWRSAQLLGSSGMV